MSDAVLIALIGLGGPAITAIASIVAQVIIAKRNRKKTTEEEAEKAKQAAIENALKEQNLETRLQRIEEKLDVHNHYAKKLEDITKSIIAIETKLGM